MSSTSPSPSATSDAAEAPEEPAAQPYDFGPEPEVVRPLRRDHIAAVLVCADGARWLPAVLTTLARSERTPHVVVAVDCESTDATGRLLEQAVAQGVVDEVVTVPRGTPFGAAVAAGVALATPGSGAWAASQQWLWLLHDDAAPAPSALEELLHASDDQPSVAVVGPKVRGWHDHRLLLECGVTVSRGGSRVTGLERGEQDQGQRDSVTDVLAVGSAGMLVRRDVWDLLGGFDPGLPRFRQDVDLCWRARRAGYRVLVTGDAVVHHREASARGSRPLPAGRTPGRADRAAGLHLLLAHAGSATYPLVLLRLLLGSLLRSIGFLLAKSPREARDELGALADLIRRPRALRASRAAVREAGRGPDAVPEREVRRLLAPRAGQLRTLGERVVGVLTSSSAADAAGADDLDDPDGWTAPGGGSRLRGWIVRPGVLLTLGLLAATAVAVRALVGTGQLLGGALLAAPPGAGDLLEFYRLAWHDVGLGTAEAAPAWAAVLALPAAVLRGQAPLAVDVLLLGAVPLAGLSAYLSLRGVTASAALRVWAAVTYALLPAITVGVGSGRLGTCVVAVLLPPLARSSARLLGAGRPPTWRRAWGTGLLLAVVAAFVPALWLAALVLAVPAAVLVAPARWRVVVAALTPAVLLGPWLLRLVADPGLLLLEPGLTGPTDRRLTGLDLMLLHPGGPGSTRLLWTVPVVVGALVALARGTRSRAVLSAWGVAFVALALGLVQRAVTVATPVSTQPVQPWPGPATLLAGAALLAAVVVAADGVRARSTQWAFGWRQPAAVLLGVALLVPPVAALLAWGTGVEGPLRRGDPSQVPAFVAADLETPARPRVLTLRTVGQHVRYQLLNEDVSTLGQRDVATAPPAEVAAAVGALVAGVGGDEVAVLAAWSVRYVQVQGAAARDPSVLRALDGAAGLRRVSGDARARLWRSAAAAPRAQLVPTPGTDAGQPEPVLLPGSADADLTVTADLPVGATPGELLLAQLPDPGWVVSADGTAVTTGRTLAPAAGRVTAPVPAGTGAVRVDYDDPDRDRALWWQLAAVAVVVLLALPGRRRVTEDADQDVPDDVLTTQRPAEAAEPEPQEAT